MYLVVGKGVVYIVVKPRIYGGNRVVEGEEIKVRLVNRRVFSFCFFKLK